MSLGPVTSSADEAAPSLAEETSTPPGVPAKVIEGRSLGRIAWIRLKRDKVAMGGGIVIVLLVLIALLAPLLSEWFGTPPNDFNSKLIDPNLGVPTGHFGGVSGSHILGVEPINGRDVFSRVVYGAQVSLLVAVLAAAVATILGTVLGMTAGFLGGWVDTVISRLMDLLLAFPQLLFSIALISVIPDKVLGIGGTSARLVVLVVVIGFFGWPYIGRIVRGQTLTLREREFIEASRSLGARSGYIIFRELLPNLVAPILVYTTLIIPTNILTEAALSYLGVGVRPPTASWGAMLSNATDYYQADPTYMIVPGVAIFITVLAFNLFGDGLRDALDPRSNR